MKSFENTLFQMVTNISEEFIASTLNIGGSKFLRNAGHHHHPQDHSFTTQDVTIKPFLALDVRWWEALT
jgi:hypothetical protein